MHRHSKSAASTGGGVPSAMPGAGPTEIPIWAALTTKNKMKHMVITNNKKRNDGNEYNTGIMC